MIAGISTASLFMRLETKDALPLFDEWNVPQTEVFLTSFCEYEPRFAKAVAPTATVQRAPSRPARRVPYSRQSAQIGECVRRAVLYVSRSRQNQADVR